MLPKYTLDKIKFSTDSGTYERAVGLYENKLVNLLLRLDKKLCNAVDDSDGTVGGFMMEVVVVLVEFAKIDFECVKTFKKLCERQTCFDWEDPLVRILDE